MTVWSTYLSDVQPMNRQSHIPRSPLLQLDSGSHRVWMMTVNGMTLTMIKSLVLTFLLPVIPNQKMSSSPSYQRYNTRLPASPFQIMWPSPRVLLTMNPSSIYRNYTPANWTIIMVSLYLLQSPPLVPTISMLPHITQYPAPCLSLQIIPAIYTFASLLPWLATTAS